MKKTKRKKILFITKKPIWQMTQEELKIWQKNVDMVLEEGIAILNFFNKHIIETRIALIDFARTAGEISGLNESKRLLALDIISREQRGELDKNEADARIKKIIGWGLSEHRQFVGLDAK